MKRKYINIDFAIFLMVMSQQDVGSRLKKKKKIAYIHFKWFDSLHFLSTACLYMTETLRIHANLQTLPLHICTRLAFPIHVCLSFIRISALLEFFFHSTVTNSERCE